MNRYFVCGVLSTLTFISPPIASAQSAAPRARNATASPATLPDTDAAQPPPPDSGWDVSDVTEDPLKRYYFLNVRGGVGVLPSFLINAWVNEASSFVTPSIGIELDTRKDGFAIIPAFTYTSFATGDMLLADKTRPASLAQNWTLINSSLKGAFATADFLWSSQIHKNASIEYGFGAGIGIIFGDLTTNWVWEDTAKIIPGAIVSNDGRHFVPCQTVSSGLPPNAGPRDTTPCSPSLHENSTDKPRVGGYTEHGMLQGGSIPPVLPYLSLPELGVRFKPTKQIEFRLMTGLSLTGIWFSLSGGYGLEQRPSK